jgi:hypothetical protein
MVVNYFAATNAHDAAAMIAPFAEDSVVEDEGRQHNGLGPITLQYEFAVDGQRIARLEIK